MGRLLSTEERARAEERRWADGLEGETESQTDEMMDRASGSEMNWKEEGGGEGGREGREGVKRDWMLSWHAGCSEQHVSKAVAVL